MDLYGDENLELIALFNDGYIRLYNHQAQLQWKRDYRHGQTIIFASEVIVADLDNDDIPELLFTTFGDPNESAGFLMVLDISGNILFVKKKRKKKKKKPTYSGYNTARENFEKKSFVLW